MTSHKARQFGLSLIELMVAMVISLITVIIMFEAISIAENYRRNTTSGGDAQTNGAVSMFSLQRDLRMAGYGFATTETDGAVARCTAGTTLVYNNRRSPTDLTMDGTGAPQFAPFLINPAGIPAGDSGTDVVQVIYGGNFGMVGSGLPITELASGEYRVTTTRAGFHPGDLILIVGNTGESCSIAEVTTLPASGLCHDTSLVDSDRIVHDTNAYYRFYTDPANCNQHAAVHWNKPGGLFTYSVGKVYNLGPEESLVARIYAIRNGQLTVCNLLSADCTDATKVNDSAVWARISDDIVSLKAQYGLDDGTSPGTANDGIVDQWSDTTPTTSAGWNQVLTARVMLVARSKQYDKNAANVVLQSDIDNSGNILWSDGSGNTALNVSGIPDWKHYRYRIFQTMVPMRNLLWK